METEIQVEQEVENPRKKIFRRLGISLFAFSVFVFFLVLKLPEARIQNFVIAHARILAQNYGYLFSAEKVKISVFLGPAIKFYNVELRSLEDSKLSMQVPYLKIRPHLLSIFFQTKKAGITAELLNGEIAGVIGLAGGVQGGQEPNSSYSIEFEADDLDFSQIPQKATLLKDVLPIEINSGIFNGAVELEMDSQDTQKTNGKVVFSLKNLGIPSQSISGFHLPKITVGNTESEISISAGQILIRKFDIGSDITKDDIVAKITGDGQIDRRIERSKINTKIVFELSNAVKSGIPLIDALLGNAKTPDGKFSFRISGNLFMPQVFPGI